MPTDSTNSSSNSTPQTNGSPTGNGNKYGGGGKKIVMGADNGCQQSDCDAIKKGLESCGNTVTFTCIDPNQESHMAGKGGDLGVFFVNGVPPATVHSFVQAIKSGSLPFTIFAHPGWEPYHNANEPNGTLASLQNVRNVPYAPEHDAGGFSSQEQMDSTGHFNTLGEYVDANSQYVALCWGATAQELAQNICNGACGGGGSTGSQTQGASAVLIPDKTFYGLIKQMCGGVDALFIIANNMAYLLSFKDFYEYRDKYDEFIPTLDSSTILSESLEKGWDTEGFYNAVEVTYDGGIVKYQNDALVQQYGENIFYYEFLDDDEETAKAKADALLSAHVRDYSLDLRLTCIYDPNITEGSWLKVAKKFTNVSGLKNDGLEAQKMQKDANGVITNKRKGLTISDFAEIIGQTDWGTEKLIQKITDEENETYEVEIEKNDYELFFVHGYILRWDKNHSLIMDLHLKYGPDTPEDPINATIGTGEVSSGGGAGAYGNDCVSVTTSQLYGDHRIPHSGAGGIEYATQNPPDPAATAAACAQGSSYEQAVKGKSGAEAFYWATQQFVYCLYADNCSKYSCNAQRFDAHECGWNCGDSNCMMKSVLDCVGYKSWVFHIDGHYHCMIEDGGQVKSVDLSRRSDQYCHSVGWPSAQSGSCGCPCAGG